MQVECHVRRQGKKRLCDYSAYVNLAALDKMSNLKSQSVKHISIHNHIRTDPKDQPEGARSLMLTFEAYARSAMRKGATYHVRMNINVVDGEREANFSSRSVLENRRIIDEVSWRPMISTTEPVPNACGS